MYHAAVLLHVDGMVSVNVTCACVLWDKINSGFTPTSLDGLLTGTNSNLAMYWSTT